VAAIKAAIRPGEFEDLVARLPDEDAELLGTDGSSTEPTNETGVQASYERSSFPPRYSAPASGADRAALGPLGMKLKNSGWRC
jgi:hypothetical protein